MDDNEYRERVARDLARWRREALISEAQERNILAALGAGEPRITRALRMGWLVTAISIVGALVLGAGVLLLIAANWESTPDWLRVAMIFAGIAASYAAGWELIYRAGLQRIGSAFLLLGGVLYVAGVFLVAQVYNVPVDDPSLFLVGAVGLLPLAYLFGSRVVLVGALALATTWQFAWTVQRHGDGADSWSAFALLGAFGIAIYAAGRLHLLRRALVRMGEVYLLAGALIVLVVTYVLTFSDLWDELIDRVDNMAAPRDVYVMLGIAAALVVAQALARARDLDDVVEAGVEATLVLLATVAVTWPLWTGWSLVFNALYFTMAAGIIWRGYATTDERYVNFGLTVLGIGLLTRYVDTFWSLLAGSAFFIVGGLLLLGLAYAMERVRRELLRSMREPDGGAPSPRTPEVTA